MIDEEFILQKRFSLQDLQSLFRGLEKLTSYEEFSKLYEALGFGYESYIQEKYERFHRSIPFWFCNLDYETQLQVLNYMLLRFEV